MKLLNWLILLSQTPQTRGFSKHCVKDDGNGGGLVCAVN
jgi:hypothetical protein